MRRVVVWRSASRAARSIEGGAPARLRESREGGRLLSCEEAREADWLRSADPARDPLFDAERLLPSTDAERDAGRDVDRLPAAPRSTEPARDDVVELATEEERELAVERAAKGTRDALADGGREPARLPGADAVPLGRGTCRLPSRVLLAAVRRCTTLSSASS